MKLLSLLLLALLATTILTEDFDTKCECDETAFLYEGQDQRLCLEKIGASGIVSIENCLEYDFDATYGLICTKCAQTHALGTNQVACHPHALDNCILAQVQGNFDDVNGYTFECQDCSQGFQVNLNTHLCVPNPDPIIEFCIKHQIAADGSTQQCIECDSTHYLKSGPASTTCVVFDSPTNCDTYEKVSEQNLKCTTCANTHPLLQDDGSACHTAGAITDCDEHYNDGTTKCKTCASTHTIRTGELNCDLTPRADQGNGQPDPTYIAGCDVYLNPDNTNWACKTCEAGKYPDSTNQQTCNSPTQTEDAMNCEKFRYSGTWDCAECQAAFPIADGGSYPTTQCYAVPTTEQEAGGAGPWTENCAEWANTSGTFSCTACNANYLLKSGECVKTEIDIPNCDLYSDLDTCSSCIDLFALEKNGCWECPAKTYVPPTTPEPCPAPVDPSNSTDPSPQPTPDPDNSSGVILQTGVLGLAIAFFVLN